MDKLHLKQRLEKLTHKALEERHGVDVNDLRNPDQHFQSAAQDVEAALNPAAGRVL